jgi:DNA-binding transcriptional MocR family regulator
MVTSQGPLYRSVADRIAALIESGTYKPGERLPSIRELSRQMRVSINTIKTAYDLLEVGRVVAPRPQSGYYVRHRLVEVPSALAIDLGTLVPTEASTGRLAALVHQDVGRRDLVMLGAAVPPVEVLPAAQLAKLLARAVSARPTTSVQYCVPPGNQELREQIAKCMLDSGCVVPPGGIVITSGCQEAVTLALLAVCAPGDTVAIESPSYFSFIQQLERLQLKGIEIPTTPADGISLEALDYALGREKVGACLLTANFSNPMGSLMSDDNKKRLLQVLEKHGVPLIEDDIYGDLPHEGERPRAVKSFDTSGTVILCSSFSKTICPGYRVGWAIPGRFQQRIEQIKMTLSVATSTPVQMAVSAYLATGAYVRQVRKARQYYAANMAAVSEALGAAFPEGTRITRPKGGMVLWLEVPQPFSSVQLFEAARTHGISIAPGPIFSLTGKYQNAVRINAAQWSPTIAKAIDTLGELARGQVGQGGRVRGVPSSPGSRTA